MAEQNNLKFDTDAKDAQKIMPKINFQNISLEENLNRAIINEDQEQYMNSLHVFGQKILSYKQSNLLKFGEVCQRNFDFCYNDTYEEEDIIIEFQQQQNEILDESFCISVYEEEEECIDSMDGVHNYFDSANELIPSLPTFDKIKYHVESLLSLLPKNQIEKKYL